MGIEHLFHSSVDALVVDKDTMLSQLINQQVAQADYLRPAHAVVVDFVQDRFMLVTTASPIRRSGLADSPARKALCGVRGTHLLKVKRIPSLRYSDRVYFHRHCSQATSFRSFRSAGMSGKG